MRYLLFLGFIFPLTTFSQHTLSVTIRDAEDGRPVPYATVFFPAQQYAFSANGSGNFVLKVDEMELDKAIIISSIGYDEYRSTLRTMVDRDVREVLLTPKITLLEEVLVKAEKETAEDLVNNASKMLKVHFREDPYYLFAFYREEILQDQRYLGFTEAYGVLHVAGYQSAYYRKNKLFSYDLAQWKNIRRSVYTVSSGCDSSSRVLRVDKLLKARSEYLYNGPLGKKQRDFTFTTDSLTTYQGHNVFVIGFASEADRENYYGKIFINADDYAVIGLKVKHNRLTDLLDMECDELNSSEFGIDFIKVGDRYYLNKVSMTINGMAGDKRTEERLQIRGGEFRANEVRRLNYDQRMIIYNEMVNPVINYDPAFWETNGDELEEDMVNDLSSDQPLSQQFFKMNGQRIIPLPDEFQTYEELYKDRDIFRLFMNNQ